MRRERVKEEKIGRSGGRGDEGVGKRGECCKIYEDFEEGE